ncbi:arginine--tRNA ligase [Comamonas sp. J-3]|uniref:arginine--tRNA ligase n=1 Tax=Comamonas trifloxystrobinivorans TaxID=3350256 RepID=UPI00372C55D5
MLQVKKDLLAALAGELDKLSPGAAERAAFETPKVAAHGDYAVTAAMQLAKPLKANPRALGEQLKAALEATAPFQQWVDAIEIAGPGFLNIRLKPAAKQQIVREVLAQGEKFGFQADRGENILVEFVSANPTGPLHVGHGRQAAIGDAISNLYSTQGWKVHREFYYNDAGVQIDTLTKSTQLRAKGFKPGDECWPTDSENPLAKNFYNGDYIADIAQAFLNKETVKADDREFTANGDVEDYDNIRQFAVAYLRNEQDKDLQAFNLKFDEYYLESSLYTNGYVEDTVKRLIDSGYTYEQDGALWLKSTEFGDDKDRVMRKSDGHYTYFLPDVAYHIQKFKRGYGKVVNIQGTDHHGTIARVRAGLQAANVGIPKGYPDYVLHTMVRVVRNGEEVKISKRAGSYVTLRDLIEWTSKDAVRFFLLSRKPDTEYTFDVDLAVAQNNDNPVYYVQYAHARICSVLRSWYEQPIANSDVRIKAATERMCGETIESAKLSVLKDVDLSALQGPQAQALMQLLAKYPEMLTAAADGNAPHDVTFYLRDLAAAYHSYYDAERILVDDEAVKLARLALVAATAQVLRNGLAVLGVSAPERM